MKKIGGYIEWADETGYRMRWKIKGGVLRCETDIR
jgi:hypothetical protein